MSKPLDYVPELPFEGFKWKWACLQCTEGINDPVVLLGVLSRMRKLEKLDTGLTYSSEEFAHELISLSKDISGRGIGVDLARRTGERNLIRNSGQYWKALGLLPSDTKGRILLTPFGRQVADAEISQADFAAITVSSFTLPNAFIQSEAECEQWRKHGLKIHPLSLILSVLRQLRELKEEPLITKDELVRIVIPLSGDPSVEIDAYARFIRAYRRRCIDISRWPNCIPAANDHRIAREFLLFLANYGYLIMFKDESGEECFRYNELIDDEIIQIIGRSSDDSFMGIVDRMKSLHIGQEVERKRILRSQRGRPFQARFRRDVLGESPRCVISNVSMDEVLIAAHIVPFKYNGANDRSNGFCMRSDIHILYDANELRILPDGVVELSHRARLSYGAQIPPCIVIPDWIDRENIRWRCDNYKGF